MKYVIAHAAWADGRPASLDKLHYQIKDAAVITSQKPEHASLWARRVWEHCATIDDDVCVLNDDVELCDDFASVLAAACEAIPDKTLALHCTAPVAESLRAAGQHWLTSYWCTGPGYVLRKGQAASLLAFAGSLPPGMLWAGNEDLVIMRWAWYRQEPIWHMIPAPVKHRTDVPSTLGYDHHPLRQTQVFGSNMDWSGGAALHVECPWMPNVMFAAFEQATMRKPPSCCMCFQRAGSLRSMTGAAVCMMCVGEMGKALMANAPPPEPKRLIV